MEHSKINYKNDTYDLSHLNPRSFEFSWRDKDGSKLTFSVRVRYGNHCYSEERKHYEVMVDDAVVQTHPHIRVFCLKRYGETERLTGIIAKIMDKPVERVGRTSQGNYHVYSLAFDDGKKSRYCIFFSLQKSLSQSKDGCTHFLDMYIESAYIKDERVGVVELMSFGTLSMKVAKQ